MILNFYMKNTEMNYIMNHETYKNLLNPIFRDFRAFRG